MNVQQFFDKWNNKYLDNDGAYGNQCVDVIKQYFVEVLGTPAIRNNAVDYWNNYPSSFLTRIPNTPSFIPIKGDIMVWGTGVGQYGHIGIVSSANVNTFISFDENWPAGSICHFQSHNYSSVLGVLRPIKDVNFDQEAWDIAVQAQKVKDEEARLAKEESDRLAREETLRVAEEQKKLAEEQAKLEEELKEKLDPKTDIDLITEEIDKINLEGEQMESEKYGLNLNDFKKAAQGSLYTLFGVIGFLIIGFAEEMATGSYDIAALGFAIGAAIMSAIGNLFFRFFRDTEK